MLVMGRARWDEPGSKVLLLDEPSMGLSSIMVDKIFEAGNVSALRRCWLVEQNASRPWALSESGLRGWSRQHDEWRCQVAAGRSAGSAVFT
jgi:ABC-type branched-subunit amino acid transport system ATPase component